MITTQALFNQFSDGTSSLKFQAIKPSLDHAVDKYLIPIFGQTYYDYLLALNTPNANETKLLEYSRKALVSFTLYEYSFISDVVLTDGGMRRGASEQSPSAYKYQIDDYRKTMLDRAFLFLEKVIQYLDLLARNNQAVAWVGSEEFQIRKALFIQSGTEFQQIIPSIRYPRRLYLLLLSSLSNIQELTIAPTINKTIYDAILIKVKAAIPNYTAEETELLKILKRAQAHLALATGIASIVGQMDENGIHVLTSGTDAHSASSKRTAATSNVLNMFVDEHKNAGEAWLSKSVEYLREKASSNLWPSWLPDTEADPDYVPLGAGFL